MGLSYFVTQIWKKSLTCYLYQEKAEKKTGKKEQSDAEEKEKAAVAEALKKVCSVIGDVVFVWDLYFTILICFDWFVLMQSF